MGLEAASLPVLPILNAEVPLWMQCAQALTEKPSRLRAGHCVGEHCLTRACCDPGGDKMTEKLLSVIGKQGPFMCWSLQSLWLLTRKIFQEKNKLQPKRISFILWRCQHCQREHKPEIPEAGKDGGAQRCCCQPPFQTALQLDAWLA